MSPRPAPPAPHDLSRRPQDLSLRTATRPAPRHLSLETATRPAPRHLSLRTATLATLLLLACKRDPAGSTTTPTRPTTVVAATTTDPCADTSIPPDTDAALARAVVLRRCGAARAVLAIHAELLQRDPQPRWAYELAALALTEDLVPEARELLQGPSARVGLALLHVAAYEATGSPADRESARTGFQAALALAPDDPYALAVALRHDLALADREPGRLALAAQICRDRIVGDSPTADGGDPRGAALLAASCARVSLAAHEPGEARRRFALALALDPAEPAPRLTWAAAELAAGNDRKAAELYAPALDAPAASDRYLAGLGLGVARSHLHDPTGAEQAYRLAAAARGWRQGDPPERLPPELQFNLGSALAGPGDPARHAEARILLRAYVDRPGTDELRRLRCRQLLLELAD